VEILGRVLGSATKVISDQVNNAMVCLLENAVTWRTIPKVLELFKSKNSAMRTKAAGFLEFMLSSYPPEVFEHAKIDLIHPIE
jgi:hypothetical protein